MELSKSESNALKIAFSVFQNLVVGLGEELLSEELADARHKKDNDIESLLRGGIEVARKAITFRQLNVAVMMLHAQPKTLRRVVKLAEKAEEPLLHFLDELRGEEE